MKKWQVVFAKGGTQIIEANELLVLPGEPPTYGFRDSEKKVVAVIPLPSTKYIVPQKEPNA